MSKTACVVLAAACVAWVSQAEAQSRRAPAVVGEPELAPASAEAVRGESRRAIADTLAWSAMQRLRREAAPTANLYGLAALTLGVACGLVPEDAELLRLQIDAWEQAGEDDRAVRATRALVKLDPRDEPALLRVINARLSEVQTADGRLKAYESLLAAESLPRPLRSRLALDAALLARETGDELGFIERLTLATTLDVSNEDAARVYAQYYLEEGGDPNDRVDVLSNLVLSAPLKSAYQHQLARELMRLGAFEGAKRWVRLAIASESAAQSYQAVGSIPSPTISNELQFDELLCVWNAEGPLACIERLQRDAQAVAQMRAQQRLAEERMGGDPDSIPPALLHYRSEVLWFMLYAALSDTENAGKVLRRIESWAEVVEDQMRALLEQDAEEASEQGVTPATIEAYRRRQSAEQLWLRLLGGIEIDRAREQLAELEAAPEADRLDDAALARFRGWVAVHERRPDAARDLLEPIAGADAGARLGLARLSELQGKAGEAAEHYRAVIELDPSTGVAAFARTRIEQVTGNPLPRTELIAALNAKALDLGPNLDRMIADPWSFVSIRAEHVEPRIGPMGRVELLVTLRNTSRLTLGVGEEQSINPRLLLSPGLQGSGHEQVTRVEAETMRLARRFSLAPGEEMTARFWGGRGSIMPLFDESLTLYATLRWRVVQGFIYLNDEYATGPSCVSAQSDTLARFPAELRGVSATAQAEQLRLARGVDLLLQMKLAAYRLFLLNEAASAEERAGNRQDDSLIRAALKERMATLSGDELGFLVCMLARYRQLDGGLLDSAMAAATAREDSDASLVLIVFALLERERGDEARALLERLAVSAQAGVAEFAEALLPRAGDLGQGGGAEGGPSPADGP